VECTKCPRLLPPHWRSVLVSGQIDMNERVKVQPANLAAAGPNGVSMRPLSTVILGPEEDGRRSLAAALRGTQAELLREAELPSVDELPRLLQDGCDVLIVDLDSRPEPGLDVVESACALDPAMTVMVYGSVNDPRLLVRCMRAGAREFLSAPLASTAVAEALVRAAARREEVKTLKKTRGKVLVFVGAKGGCGVTTIASNFAVLLAKESGQNVALADLNLRLGDAALTLGLTAEFSTLDALQQEKRLDSELMGKLLTRHSSGLNVLAAPNDLTTFQPTEEGIKRLTQILRNDFAWVVVDAGCAYASYTQALFDAAEKVYLVAQVSVADLRNAHHIVQAHFEKDDRRKLEVVLNRVGSASGDIDGESIQRALMVPPNWKVPSDFHAARAAQNTATALVSKDGSVTRVLIAMARAACGKGAVETRKRMFGLF
jgi:pilus assembly protein CpaE